MVRKVQHEAFLKEVLTIDSSQGHDFSSRKSPRRIHGKGEGVASSMSFWHGVNVDGPGATSTTSAEHIPHRALSLQDPPTNSSLTNDWNPGQFALKMSALGWLGLTTPDLVSTYGSICGESGSERGHHRERGWEWGRSLPQTTCMNIENTHMHKQLGAGSWSQLFLCLPASLQTHIKHTLVNCWCLDTGKNEHLWLAGSTCLLSIQGQRLIRPSVFSVIS